MSSKFKSICWTCSNYIESPDGCREFCNIHLTEPLMLTQYYWETRRDGLKRNCKDYKFFTEGISK